MLLNQMYLRASPGLKDPLAFTFAEEFADAFQQTIAIG